MRPIGPPPTGRGCSLSIRCRVRLPKGPAGDDDGEPLAPFPVNWAKPEQSRLSAGNSLPVRYWQVDHAQWTARFKAPHLILEAGDATGGVVCAYELSGGQATIGRI